MADTGKHLREGIRNSAIVKNPVLFEAVGLAPVVAMAVSLKSAIMLAAVSALELLLIELFASLLLRRLKSRYRMPIYAVLGMLINIPCFMFFEHFTPNEANSAGIFLPLLAVNSLIALHCERFAVKHRVRETLVDAVSAGAGYAFVVLIVGTLREILGSGTIYSVPLHFPVRLQGLLLPFGGFLLIGFFAAGMKSLIRKKYPDAHPEQAFDMREISQSHIGKIRTLLNEDFNPYAEEDSTEFAHNTDFPLQKKEKSVKPPKMRREKSAKKSPRVNTSVSETASVSTEKSRLVRKTRNDYLQDFDEMLSELDAYKQKQSSVPTGDVPQKSVADTENLPKNDVTENGEEEK